jgi:hypothetical protein
MVDLLCDQYHYYFANLIAASNWQCRAAHILKDRGATGLFRAPTIAELKSVRKRMRIRARQTICFIALRIRDCCWQ